MTELEKLELDTLQTIVFAGDTAILLTKGELARDYSGILSQPIPTEKAMIECEKAGATFLVILPDNGRGKDDLFLTV